MMEIIQLTLINNTYIDLRKAAIAINMQSHSSYYLYLILRAQNLISVDIIKTDTLRSTDKNMNINKRNIPTSTLEGTDHIVRVNYTS